MLVSSAAVLTSAALGLAVGAVGVPAVPTAADMLEAPTAAVVAAEPTAAQSAWAAALDGAAPAPFIGPQPAAGSARVPIAELPRLRGLPLLQQLGMLSRVELVGLEGAHPELVSTLLDSPPRPTAVAGWWSRLGGPARGALRSTMPQLVGNLEGLPYTARDAANRRFVRATVTDITDRLASGVGRADREQLESTLHMLEQVREAIRSEAGEPRRQLASIDITGEGRAVIVVGDLDTADSVSLLVPGMFYGVDARIVPWTGVAADLAAQQADWLTRLGRGDERTAVVSWIGYHTPTLVNVASMENARQGRDALTATMRGLAAARPASPPYLAVLAHSYGATAALLALQENDVHADALAMVGSAGSPAESVGDLAVPAGRVWVGAADWDPIPQSGVFGSQPMSPEYGALVLGVDGGVDPQTGDRMSGSLSHNDYFAADSEAMRNFALIGIGAGDLVLGVDGDAPAIAAGMERGTLASTR